MSHYNMPPGFGTQADLDHVYGRTDDIGVEEFCTPKKCCSAELEIASIECCGCKRRTCGSCAIKLAEELYCPSCAKCELNAIRRSGVEKCDCLAVAWCDECGALLCSEHAARLPDRDLCVSCAKGEK